MDTENLNKHRDRLELYNTVILAIATLSVAWCSYQSTLWNGVQTFHLAESNKYSRLAQQKLIQSGQNMAMEEAVVIGFVNAVVDGNKQRADYIIKGVKPELSKILSDWLKMRPMENSSAPLHPMATPAYHELMQKRIGESENMSEMAAKSYEAGRKANLNGDSYSLLTVLFSTVMFLGAIATKLARPQLSLTLIIISALICAIALIMVSFYPVAHKG